MLRFRSDAVSRLTGIPFRKVTVRKGIWYNRQFCEPSIALANAYSHKLFGRLVSDRSVWHIDPVERWVAPENLYEQLAEHAGDRIQWGMPDDFIMAKDEGPIISTAPLPLVMAALDMPPLKLVRAGINVDRYRIYDADLFQTIYFPDLAADVYRASITGELLIIERIDGQQHNALPMVMDAFCIRHGNVQHIETVEQKYGKIIPLPDEVRKRTLFKLTHQHGIYSLGRFACWRNLLLDDVVDDIDVIKRLLRSGQVYDVARLTAS